MTISKKDYAGGKIKTVAVENSKAYRDWVFEKVSGNSNGKSRSHILCRDNQEAFEKLWGKQDWCYNGEFRFRVWVREHEGETYIVLTSKHKGTCVEMVGNCDEVRLKGKNIVGFMSWLWKKLKEQK